jgi:hypothetical protein
MRSICGPVSGRFINCLCDRKVELYVRSALLLRLVNVSESLDDIAKKTATVYCTMKYTWLVLQQKLLRISCMVHVNDRILICVVISHLRDVRVVTKLYIDGTEDHGSGRFSRFTTGMSQLVLC